MPAVSIEAIAGNICWRICGLISRDGSSLSGDRAGNLAGAEERAEHVSAKGRLAALIGVHGIRRSIHHRLLLGLRHRAEQAHHGLGILHLALQGDGEGGKQCVHGALGLRRRQAELLGHGLDGLPALRFLHQLEQVEHRNTSPGWARGVELNMPGKSGNCRAFRMKVQPAALFA